MILIDTALFFVDQLLGLYFWVLLGSVILSWLVSFGIVDTRNQVVMSIGQALYALTEPALKPIRQTLPSMGPIDISPVILMVAVFSAQHLIDLIRVDYLR
jgi:YggT family protein